MVVVVENDWMCTCTRGDRSLENTSSKLVCNSGRCRSALSVCRYGLCLRGREAPTRYLKHRRLGYGLSGKQVRPACCPLSGNSYLWASSSTDTCSSRDNTLKRAGGSIGHSGVGRPSKRRIAVAIPVIVGDLNLTMEDFSYLESCG